MPPFVSRKRRSTTPDAPPAKRQAIETKSAIKRAKPSLFDAVDTPSTSRSTPQQTKAFLETLDDQDDSSLSDISSDEFEDVPVVKKRKGAHSKEDDQDQDEEDDEEDEMDWEDAIQGQDQQAGQHAIGAADEEIGDLSISLNEDGAMAAAKAMADSNAKKGPSKRERTVRIRTHCLHVQAMMWHNAVRNSWLNDKQLQKTLVDGLGDGVRREIDRWREDMGMAKQFEQPNTSKSRAKGRKHAKGKKAVEKRDGRDWGVDADRLEKGAINMSAGDPLLRLLKILTAYWRKKFLVIAPGLRKQGYMPLRRLGDEIRAWKKNRQDFEAHGERVESLEALRRLAFNCEGSRDVGSQLFTALLRALGLEARMVANLQPAGIGWGKNEEAKPKKGGKTPGQTAKDAVDLDSESELETDTKKSTKKSSKKSTKSTPAKALKAEKPIRKSDRQEVKNVIDLDSDGSDLSSIASDIDDDDASIVDITPSTPKRKDVKKYDRDLPFPIYWTEVRSPVSNTYIPVDPIILSTVASNQELLSSFEPRGKRADQAKQVMCYTIAHSPDGSAKDVTVRYLKKHQLPGRTKGYRMPVEKIKVYNKRGKVKKYEDCDWFKTVMSSYERPQFKRTTADDLEESTDLKPYKPAADKSKVEIESLQWYKQSAEFVLERHLRREEALLPDSKPVKTFVSGKGDKLTEEPVYRRSDVVPCKTAESWHKEGREIKLGEQPLKMVPIRAVTTIRKREIEDAERETGEKPKQGLFSYDQCEWIIPPPIKDGVIPRNAFGNMDVYTPSMVPKGAVHVPLKGTARICRKLDIDYAEACTGFEFGNRRAVPVLTGVVVAQENEDAVIDAWEIEEVEKRRKEDVKKQALTLHLWRKFLMGMRIVERMRTEYADSGGKEEAANPFVNREREKQRKDGSAIDSSAVIDLASDDGSVAGGGFLLPGEDDGDEEDDNASAPNATLDVEMDLGGGFMVDDADNDVPTPLTSARDTPVLPMSLQSAHSKANGTTTTDTSDDDIETDELPTKPRNKQVSGTKAKANPKSVARPKARDVQARAPKQEVTSDEYGELSVDLDGTSQDSEVVPPSKKTSARRSSPRVIISPRKARTATSVKRRTSKKETPLKSRYFEGKEDKADDLTADDDGLGSEDDEQEVVKPRMTTARTRAKAR